jgi:Tol biopolymer transport system component
LPEGACSDPDAAGELLWSPDGRALYAPLSNGLWRFSRDGGAPRRIVAEEPLEPSVSPDGRTLVFGLSRTPSGDTGEQLYVLSVSGGHPRLLNSEFAAAPAFSPDGKLIAFVPRDREEIETVPLSGGAAAGLTPFPAAKTEVCCLTWSPTGKQLAFDASAKRSES